MSENKNPKVHTADDLIQMQSYPLYLKIMLSNTRIRDWYREFYDVYVSFSGGKDSTVLADMVAKVCKDFGWTLTLVFSDTGLEYPEVRKFVPFFAEYLRNKYEIKVDLIIVKPEMTFKQVIQTVGYPIGSKKIARMIYDCKHPTEKNQATRTLYLTGVKRDGSISKAFTIIDPMASWAAVLSQVTNYLHGRKMRIYMDWDRNYYYEGRCEVNSFKSDKRTSKIVIDCDCDPYKIEKNSPSDPWLWDTFSFVDGIIYQNKVTVSGTKTVLCKEGKRMV